MTPPSKSSPRWVCVHGHFYQPPRENPWLDAIEPQPSAAPYPDWNQRITAECYRPNASARIVDGGGHILGIIDNYARMSFNFGPTLLTWLAREAPDVHEAVVRADVASRARFGGHGAAMAQAYNHIIMPLATRRDQLTQVRWGKRDFVHRFGREPLGMWLPETAVSVESLECLAAEGIAFTVLAPYQAARVRAPGGPWQDVAAADPSRVYRCNLPSGRRIDLFFYDGELSRHVAFEKLLNDGALLAGRLAQARTGLSHIATDGETYGHHHRYGDMALAWALTSIERGDHRDTRLTVYEEFRARHPATWEVEIRDETAWSCAHGIDRWREDCGCSGGAGNGTWNQKWRRPLRDALDWLRDRAADVLERASAGLFVDPWAARDDYIGVLLDRATTDDFLARHTGRALTGAERVRALELMELARHAMLMYTSCGWFFDDLSGIETVQILQYAARVCELCGDGVEAQFVDRLAGARSNVASAGDGRQVWRERVVTARVDLPKVVAHWATTHVLHDGEVTPEAVYCYRVAPHDVRRRRTGKARLLAGVALAASDVTGETTEVAFAVVHAGEHHLVGGVKAWTDAGAWERELDELDEVFLGADLLATQRVLDRAFAGATFSLGSLFARERSEVLDRILARELRDADAVYRGLYDEHAPLMRYLVRNDLPVPGQFATAGRQVLRRRILSALEKPVPSFDEVRATMAEARQVNVDLDRPAIAYAAGLALHRMIAHIAASPEDPDPVERLARMAEIAVTMRSQVDLWDAQNAAWRIREAQLPLWRMRAKAGDETAERLVAAFSRLAQAIRVAVE
ncbi:MAG: DUF3536 domain-containing protein [Deltaproteobacteria bacterium]|nr:DUF3536 domain-containing protein [Kofleriaceae bacterium]